MTGPSNWPLPKEGLRLLTPQFLIRRLSSHPLTRGLYPRAMGYYPHAKGHSVRRTAHGDHLMLYCTEGSGRLLVNKRLHKVERGDLIMLPRDVLHAYASSGHAPWTVYWVHFEGDDVDAFWEHMAFDDAQPVRRVGSNPRIAENFETLLEVRNTGYRQGYYVHAANHLRQMIGMFGILNTSNAVRSSADHFDLEKIQLLMHQKLHSHLDLASLAATANMSRYSFCRRYKTVTGYSPYQHFLHLKMERACYLLDISDRSITEVADTLGYEDAFYFSRLFRRVIGLSPTQYRASSRG